MAVENLFASDVGVATLREACDEALAEHDDGRARLLLRQLWDRHPGPSQSGFVASRWAKCAAPSATVTSKRVMVLRSFTVEPAIPLLRAGGLLNGLDLDVSVGGFNAYAQEILDPRSDLYGESAPDIVILAVHTRDVAPDLWRLGADSLDSAGRERAADRVLNELTVLVEAFRERSSSPLIIHGLEVPPTLGLGLADRRDAFGQRAAIEHVNRELASVADRTRSDFLDWDALASSVGRSEMCDEAKWRSIRMPLSSSALVSVSQSWLRVIHPLVGQIAKVLVVDLDNTMWGGIVGEDGVGNLSVDDEGVGAPFREVQRALVEMRARGILLAVCSKNQHADGLSGLDDNPAMLLHSNDFHALRVNWADKATNLREIAAELNVGIDSLAFLDDNPAERLLVATNAPEVTVLPVSDDPSTFAEAIRSCPLFERIALTGEDRQRSDFYSQQRLRSQSRADAPSLENYLASLDTSVSVGIAVTEQLARIAQLTQKTNQFNMTTRRYSEQEVVERHESDVWRVYALSASDRFGDHGLVAAALVECAASAWRIDTLLMSCRVIGRDVESALIANVAEDALASGVVSALIGEFAPTAKNGPAEGFYGEHGFLEQEQDGELRSWVLDVTSTPIEVPEWVHVVRAEIDSNIRST